MQYGVGKRYAWILCLVLFPAIVLGIGFDLNDPKKIEILRHFDIPASFLKDPYLHDIYSEKKRECILRGVIDTDNSDEMFIPMLSSLISQSDLPNEFIFVALVESRLRVGSLSPNGAAGLWQFMEKTGKLNGLKIDQYVDERRDHVKSTRAAITYLSTLRKKFGKWYLALIAYNCGDGKLQKALRKAGTSELNVLTDPKKNFLPNYTKEYIRRVVALALLATDDVFVSQLQYDSIVQNQQENPLATVYLPEGEPIDRIAAVLEMPKQNLLRLNTHLKKGVTPPNEEVYPVYIPKAKLEEFREKFYTRDLKGYFVRHRIRADETLASLSARYQVPKKAIMRENMIGDDSEVFSNRIVRIPIHKPFLKNTRFHTVRTGETLASVAAMYNMTIKQIRESNPFVSARLEEGQEVEVGD